MDEVLAMIIDDDLRAEAIDKFAETVVAGARGSMKAWMESHAGQCVTTVQAGWRPWMVTDREVFTPRSSYVNFGTSDGSRRDYKGCKVVGSTSTTLLINTDDGQEVLYYVTD